MYMLLHATTLNVVIEIAGKKIYGGNLKTNMLAKFMLVSILFSYITLMSFIQVYRGIHVYIKVTVAVLSALMVILNM